ncbi:MAG: DUF3990 domain-containing protein [Propionibacteriaceae bacterium]|jgi:hypothetical protein|nr:DUF3990 domain-containing protein [Propionibacteriaceae bacterium]
MSALYHGSNAWFDRPLLSAGRNRRDFGIGFYTTTLRAQAEDWAISVTERALAFLSLTGREHV